MNRKQFIIKSGALAIGTALLNSSCTNTKATSTNTSNKKENIDFAQSALPYSFDALEPNIDKLTMEIHYGKHAAAYAKNFKEAYSSEKITDKTYEDLFGNINKYSNVLRNNGGGHYNHELFWKTLQPQKEDNKPSGKLLNEIQTQYKSFDNFKLEFERVAKSRFGSGWAWLIVHNNSVLITDTANQDNPLMKNIGLPINGQPILGLDVWEHAYYLKYQNKRADYIANFWKIVNWNFVEQKFNLYV